MKINVGVGVAISAAAILLTSSMTVGIAHAEPTPTPSPTTTVFRTPLEQFMYEKDQYQAALKARDIAIKLINQIFKAAVDKSNVDYRAAMQLAKTADQKFLAANARKNALTAAIAIRDEAIAELGRAPSPPVEPLKMGKFKSPKSKARN
jgi:hypothetical protein